MTKNLAKLALSAARGIQDEVPRRGTPPDEGLNAETEQVIAASLVRNTRGYIEKIVNQINGCYEHGWYDGCAVMIRRLIETLIIEAFEQYSIAHKIKNSTGDFFYLGDLISMALVETCWNLGRNARGALPKLKSVGDLSAHSRRFIAHRHDIDKVKGDLRIVVQEFVYLAKLK